MSEPSPSPIFPRLEALRATLAEKPPFCSGTLELPRSNFVLYYGPVENAQRVDLCGPSSEAGVLALNQLESACEAATFGRNQETVLDESYRKAGKMDPENFVLKLDASAAQLVDIVHAGLLSGESQKKDIKAELYKLNVYGEGAFFKAHKDTPRGSDMFGSLVVVFPTPHQGGALVLRHEGQEWTFDAAQILSASSTPSEADRIAYIAFFSDVEHEVLPVTSGHRVTITYNLYWSEGPPVAFPPGLSVLYPKHSSGSDMTAALSSFLDDPTILPNGGTLGFALRHVYPFPDRWNDGMANPLDSVRQWLKGSDAALFEACEALSLHPVLRLITQSDESEEGLVIMDEMVHLGYVESSLEYALCHYGFEGVRAVKRKFDGTLDRVYNRPRYDSDDEDSKSPIDIYWVTKVTELNRVSSDYAAYGNEASTGYLYMDVSLLVDVGPPGERKNIENVRGVILQ